MDKPVTIADYDPSWSELYEEERGHIAGAWCEFVVDIQHIGSTAVPGLGAKPIVDIMVGVRTLPPKEEHITALKGLGYEYYGEASIPGRHFFVKRTPRTYQVHVVLHGAAFWGKHLLFRDYLRAHPEEARRYEKLKRELAAQFGADRDCYTEAKGPFIESVLARAREWQRCPK